MVESARRLPASSDSDSTLMRRIDDSIPCARGPCAAIGGEVRARARLIDELALGDHQDWSASSSSSSRSSLTRSTAAPRLRTAMILARGSARPQRITAGTRLGGVVEQSVIGESGSQGACQGRRRCRVLPKALVWLNSSTDRPGDPVCCRWERCFARPMIS